jgi:hypothetical protein
MQGQRLPVLSQHMNSKENTVGPQSPFGVFKNCGTQTN